MVYSQIIVHDPLLTHWTILNVVEFRLDRQLLNFNVAQFSLASVLRELRIECGSSSSTDTSRGVIIKETCNIMIKCFCELKRHNYIRHLTNGNVYLFLYLINREFDVTLIS